MSGCNSVCPYAYSISNDVNLTVLSSLLLIIFATCSIRFSKFGIWYFSFWMALLSDLASNAILTDLSRLTVITTGCMKTSSLFLSTCWMCPSANNLSISCSTASWSCSDTHLPFCWVIFAFSLKAIFLVCPFLFLFLVNNYLTIIFNVSLSDTFSRLYSTHYYSLLRPHDSLIVPTSQIFIVFHLALWRFLRSCFYVCPLVLPHW